MGCGECLSSGDCPGERVCVNLGNDDALLADWRCVDACESAADCAVGGQECHDTLDGIGNAVAGCYAISGTFGFPLHHCAGF